MTDKDIWLIFIAIAGWTWGIFQFFLKRKYQKKDKLTDKRFEAYTAYMKKSDELMNNVRTNPDIIFGIPSDFMATLMKGDEQEINDALIKFNDKLLDFVKKASEPLMILSSELNSFLIICSKDLSEKIDEFNLLTTDFNNDMQRSLSMISSNDSNSVTKNLETLAHDDRWKRFESLNKEIIQQMRSELGSDK